MCDVGCGDGRLLRHLLQRHRGGHLPELSRFVGTDTNGRLLGRAERKTQRELEAAEAAEAAGVQDAVDAAAGRRPAIEWLRGSLATLELGTPADVLTLIEVVEHL